MVINVIIDEGAKMPTKAHKEDAGFDLYSPERFIIRARDSKTVNTGVHMEIPVGYTGFLKSKSGLNIGQGIRCEGVIDCGYTGSIVAKLYNDSDAIVTIEKGQKITQIVILPIPDVDLVEVDEFAETERGNGGFGSSGKF